MYDLTEYSQAEILEMEEEDKAERLGDMERDNS